MPRLKDLAETTRDAFMIDPRKIKIDHDYNLRDLTTPQAVEALAQLGSSIKESGLRVPLLVRLEDEEIILVQGHRRHAAIMALIAEGEPIKSVPCLSEDRRRGPEDRTLDLFLSNEGEPLTELEKAEGVARLISYGWAEDQIAKRLGRSPGYIRHLRSLDSELPERVKNMVREGQVAASTALKTVKAEGAEQGTAILEEARADAEREAEATDQRPPMVAESTPAPAPKPKKVTEKRIAATKERKTGITRDLKPRKAGMPAAKLDEALLTQIKKFLGKCIDGSYENEDDEVPERLVSDAKELASTINFYEGGMRTSEAAE